MIRALVATVIVLMGIPGAYAQGGTPDSMRFLDKSAAAMEAAQKQTPPAWLTPNPARSAQYENESKAILNRTGQAALAAGGEQHRWDKAYSHGERIIVFVTLGNGFQIKSILKDLAAYKDDSSVSIVIAGLPTSCADKGFACAIRKLYELSGDQEGAHVSIDPVSFRKFGITSVPAMVLLRQGKEVARVSGLANPDWLRKQVESKTGDLGKYGPTVDVAERNLMDQIRDRMAKVDWAKQKQEAMDGFWKHQKMVPLPRATENNERRFTPTVEATADITDMKGNVLVAKGTEVNPLEKVPFTRSVIVFNAKDPAEVAEADRLRLDAWSRHKKPILVATELPDASFDGHAKLESKFDGAPVYLLNKTMENQFQIRKTLTVVEADAHAFIIREHAVHSERGAK